MKEVNPSSGDSDSQAYSDDVHAPPHPHTKHAPHCPPVQNAHTNAQGGEQSTSGGDADAEMTERDTATGSDAARVKDSKGSEAAQVCLLTAKATLLPPENKHQLKIAKRPVYFVERAMYSLPLPEKS